MRVGAGYPGTYCTKWPQHFFIAWKEWQISIGKSFWNSSPETGRFCSLRRLLPTRFSRPRTETACRICSEQSTSSMEEVCRSRLLIDLIECMHANCELSKLNCTMLIEKELMFVLSCFQSLMFTQSICSNTCGLWTGCRGWDCTDTSSRRLRSVLTT